MSSSAAAQGRARTDMVVPKERTENVVDFAEAKRFAAHAEEPGEPTEQPEQARLRAQVSAAHEFVTALGVLTTAIDSSTGESEILEALDHALETVIRATSAKDGALLVRDDANGDLIFALAWGDTPKSELLWKRVPKGQGIAHWVVENRRPAIVNDVSSDERFYKEIDNANDFRTRSILAAPLIDGDQVIGVLEVLNKRDGEYFTISDQNHLTLLAHLAAVVLSELGKRKA